MTAKAPITKAAVPTTLFCGAKGHFAEPHFLIILTIVNFNTTLYYILLHIFNSIHYIINFKLMIIILLHRIHSIIVINCKKHYSSTAYLPNISASPSPAAICATATTPTGDSLRKLVRQIVTIHI